MEAINNIDENDDLLNIDDFHDSINVDKQLLDVDHKVRLFYDKSTANTSNFIKNQSNLEKINNDESVDTIMFLSYFENTKHSDIDLKSIKLIQKQSLIDLIHRNREHGILCPFDEIVYLNSNEKSSPIYNKKLIDLNIYELNEVTKRIMPISVSTFLMPFFFDIFQPSLLNLFSRETVDILIKLKYSYKQQIFLDNDSFLNSYILEDILWNCFALFKYKFGLDYKKGFLNYFFAIYCVLKHFELSLERNICLDEYVYLVRKKINKIKQVMPCFVEALILNGLLTRRELCFFLNLNFSKLIKTSPHSKFEIEYACEAVQIFRPFVQKYTLFRLSDMCRIAIKTYMKYFSVKTVQNLNCSDKIKQFILFDKEFHQCFETYKNN